MSAICVIFYNEIITFFSIYKNSINYRQKPISSEKITALLVDLFPHHSLTVSPQKLKSQ